MISWLRIFWRRRSVALHQVELSVSYCGRDYHCGNLEKLFDAAELLDQPGGRYTVRMQLGTKQLFLTLSRPDA